ncbi:MAG TPA: hypothetical protein VFV67_20670 [Actinophytocola sp.]|uniref:hypothetical protein n=1 Tax=Actinophytocola sp. TaxID=1872138 RepID=UPI002DB6535C|nr:hypothetical protein [Actinophytocola sp.]HEU5473067.1 hypothetical protein [Actinophytocola sp.]
MTELERRLRTGLDSLAATVPPSENPWAEQQRRLAADRRPPHRLLLAGAAAAVVAGSLVLVPALVVSRPAAPPTPPPTTAPPSEVPWMRVIAGPFALGRYTAGPVTREVITFVKREPGAAGWINRLCVVSTYVGTAEPTSPDSFAAISPDCVLLPTEWPARQPPGLVQTHTILDGGVLGGGPLPGTLLFVTAPQVAKLEVCAGDGSPATVKELARTAELVLFQAQFATSYVGFCFTARDAAGTVLDSGIS